MSFLKGIQPFKDEVMHLLSMGPGLKLTEIRGDFLILPFYNSRLIGPVVQCLPAGRQG